MRRCFLGAIAAALVTASGAQAAGPSLLLGATEDGVRSTTLAETKAEMDKLVLAGFRGVRITQIWTPGDRAPTARDRTILQNVATAAKLDNVTVLTSVMNQGSRTTPLTPDDQADFAAYAVAVVKAVPALKILIVGNEPNLNRYWLPQFNDDGSDAAAPAYESLLAQTYDAVKAAAPGVTVLGGAVSPRGGDVAGGIRPTHSPTVFIHDLGQAMRDSGRTTPIMDGFAFHPYEDNSSVAPVDGLHPNSTTIALGDYDKLVASLGEAFGDYELPIWYDEFGVESLIPAKKASFYTNAEPTTTKPVDEATQAAYYRQAVQLVFCQPNVRGLFLFHTVDEKDMTAWQSGVYYADGTPKSSLTAVKAALDESRRGVIASCPGLQLTVHPRLVQKGNVVYVVCDLDCTWTAELYRLPGKLLARKTGYAVGGHSTGLRLRVPAQKAKYRLRFSASAPMNPGPTTTKLVGLRPG